ncbi:MAG: hypothetical protein EAZ91_02575 [Cytophagales bacterium]|nr:MAG: hypothetical protein EAZ91_02575 [Cytophagales bacterium]
MNPIYYLFKTLGVPFTRSYLLDWLADRQLNSLSDFSSLLDTYRVANLAARLEPGQLTEVSLPCLAHCQPENEAPAFVVITAVENRQVAYFEGKKTKRVAVAEFAKLWSGAVLLLAPDAQSGEPNYAQNRKSQQRQTGQRVLAGLGLGLLALVLLNQTTNGPEAGWLLVQFLGLGLCVLLLINEFGKPALWIGKLCQVGKQTNCQAVLHSPGARLFGWLSLAEVGFVYFLGTIFSFALSSALPAKGLVAGAVLPLTLWSVYYQGRVAKAWCTLCLGVMAVLWISFGVSFPLGGSPLGGIPSVALNQLGALGGSWLVAAGLWFLVRPFVVTTQQKRGVDGELGRWRHNSSLFLASLRGQSSTDLAPLPDEDQIGSPDAPVVLTMVSNPHCNPCKDAYRELTTWQNYFCDELQLRIRHINSGEERYQTHDTWAEQAAIEYTPTLFINGRKLPEPYSVNDIRYHIRALAEA